MILSTDVPIIISGEKVAYLEPQQVIWESESGRSFTVSELQDTDNLTPFDGISGFKSSGMTSYSKTIFRFPLRRKASGMSENLYDVSKVRRLIDALREEAKLLLVFLRSINTIEVYDISQDGTQTLCFKTEVSEKHKESLGRKRKRMMERLRSAYSTKSYDLSGYVEFSAKFNIKVSGIDLKEDQCGISHWLVCNQVGSEKKEILEAAAKQKVFPWVGAALQLDRIPECGRIYCFLPMPIEASSKLPVHVNGTFGLTDDRRSLKWPGTERKNDRTADWNKTLVSEVLPRCYVSLLLEASKHLSCELFYKVWPDEGRLRKDTWGELLRPLYTSLFDHPVFWSKVPRKEGEWIEAKQGCFVKRDTKLDIVIQESLVSCNVKVVSVPANVWAALKLAEVEVKEITPKLVRRKLKDSDKYVSLNRQDKCLILDYCLLDKQYHEILEMHLLPLFNGKFIRFQKDTIKGVNKVYVASKSCPSDLLPNVHHLLVDLTKEFPSLHEKLLLLAGAKAKVTQVRLLTDGNVADLLEHSMPAAWKKSELVPLPAPGFTEEWFELFWKWAQADNRKIKPFVGKFILPVSPRPPHSSKFCAIKLNPSQAVVYIPSGQRCSEALQQSLNRLSVSVCHQDDFPYVHHTHLKTYVKSFDTNGLLDAISSAPNFSKVKLTSDEAKILRDFFNPSMLSSNPKRVDTLMKLGVFVTAENTAGRLMSVHEIKSVSTLKKAVAAPLDSCLDISKLPPSFAVFSQADQCQKQLLQKLQVALPSDCDFIINHVFPMLRHKSCPDALLDEIMVRILDAFHALKYNYENIKHEIGSLPFVRTSGGSGGRKSPKELFDPRDPLVVEVFEQEPKFPIAPYNSDKYLDVLKQCGLRTVITDEEILAVVQLVGVAHSSSPQRVDQAKLTRASALLKYICKEEFLEQVPDREAFSQRLTGLSRKKSWLPVLAKPPPGYPQELSWKGRDYPSHVMSLDVEPHHITSADDTDTVALLAGSQVFLSNPPLAQCVAEMFPPCDSLATRHLTAHLQEIIGCCNRGRLERDHRLRLLQHIYRELLLTKASSEDFSFDPVSSEWLYVDKLCRFVKPSIVAVEKNPTFRYDLEPYVFLLPEMFREHEQLFLQFEMHKCVSREQIVSVLSTIHNQLSQGTLAVEITVALDLVHNILNWLTAHGTEDISDLVQSSDVYIPVESGSQELQLENARDVIYCDSDFMKEFASSESESKLLFSDSFIDQKMAECLGLRLLSEEMDMSEDAFEDTGQHEPLTQRLTTILKEYKDGLTIIKELLQNADDAEATEFNICFDNREHKAKKEKLFFQGMMEAHGPALVVHNNKTFTDADFVNITKLAGATKAKKQLKIGKFGVGFCSVYHMTDVPSFVSRDLLHIFDPTLMCLGKAVKNLSQPGKKVKFTEKMISRSDQLNPYVGLFGFKKNQSYSGTIFRLPFRKAWSELSRECYNEERVQKLLTSLQNCSSRLLLFLQNVKRITFQRIDGSQTEPTVLFEVTKSLLPANLPQQVQLMELTQASSSEHWLIANKKSELSGKHATASVACSLGQCGPSTYRVNKVEGEVFCFLPLSQKPGLPVHISANFAVISNRRGIWTSDEVNDKADAEVEWNNDMVKQVLPRAYCDLLVALQQMHSEQMLMKYSFYSLWPLEGDLKIDNPWKQLLRPFYKLISNNTLFLSTTAKWLKLCDCKILDECIVSPPTEMSTPKCVLDILTHLKTPLVDLPAKYFDHLSLKGILITENEFVKMFFLKLSQLNEMKEKRNEVIQNLLEIYAAEYDDETERSYFLDSYLRKQACIPSSPDGAILRKCSELIDLDSPYAELFDKSDGHFLDEVLASRQLCHTALTHLGIHYRTIPLYMLMERAKTVTNLMKTNKTKALDRVKLILNCLENEAFQKEQESSQLSKISFLPVVQKPDGYLIQWKGKGVELSSGEMLTLSGKTDSRHSETGENTVVAGSQVLFVDERSPKLGGCGYIDTIARQILKIRRYPTCTDACNQLKVLVSSFRSTQGSTMVEWTSKVCEQIYRFLENEIQYAHEKKKPAFDFREMRQLHCIWTGSQFVSTSQVAKNWTLNGPYLYNVPPILLSQAALCSELRIREHFSEGDVTTTLQKMANKFGSEPIDDVHKELFKALLPSLSHIKPPQFDTKFRILLPDQDFVLRRSDELSYNDAEWAPHDDKYTYVNDIISSNLAKQLLIKPVSSEVLEMYTLKEKSFFDGVEFGQREELTQRIHNILRDYSFDITILKELLQNTDDAKATKMYVILDKRSHGKKKVFSENWQKLQGPALLIWNNSTFDDKDLKGIQKLGLGSKRKDCETIGQYGIGFNAVYHLTDCPSFVTGRDILCVLDPHCHFIPGATSKAPGRMMSGEFWSKYPDIKSAYLREGIGELSSEIRDGSLFRFPLRCTKDLVDMSQIIKAEEYDGNPEDFVLTAEKMHSHIKEWAPKMKNAMFFLNHVTELKFCTIEENANVAITEYHYKTHVGEGVQQKREQLHRKVSEFKNVSGNDSFLIHYRLTLTDMSSKHARDESWIIQQGIGDPNREDQKWQFVKQVKPKHGLAAPLKVPAKSPASTYSVPSWDNSRENFRGQVFCFLPIPSLQSHLPVHINGNFILDSTRLNMWYKNDMDDKTRWNANLITAIGSSYAKFLEHIKDYFFPMDAYKSWHPLLEARHGYYSIFPQLDSICPEKRWQSLSNDVYDKLVASNSKVIVVVDGSSSTEQSKLLKICWHSPTDRFSSQVYFWRIRDGRADSDKAIRPIFENLGMRITSAPLRLMDHINDALRRAKLQELAPISPLAVYRYYTEYHDQLKLSRSGLPCSITDTAFHSIANFKEFTQYTLSASCFPDPPYGFPLLLTEDGQLRNFDAENKVISSKFCSVFPQSPHRFLHHEMLDVWYTDEYFAKSLDKSDGYKVVQEVLSALLPSALFSSLKVNNENETIISNDKLKRLWECFTMDLTFSKYLSDITRDCALVPSMDGCLFSSRSRLQPIIPDSDKLYTMITEVLKSIDMPFANTALMGTEAECPKLNDCQRVLENLYHLFLEDKSRLTAQMNWSRAHTIIEHVKQIDFRFDYQSQKFAMSIPLYEAKDGKFTSIYQRTVYIWPSAMCDTAYTKWAQHEEVTFLNPSAAWASLCSADILEVKKTTAEEIYVKFVFKQFFHFTDEERCAHLKYIRDRLYDDNVHFKDKMYMLRHTTAAQFISDLHNLKCLKAEDNTLRKVSEFCDHKQVIFKTFSQNFQFLPSQFKDCDEAEEWMQFFIKLGLKQTVTKDEFVGFCTEVSKGRHSRISEASTILVKHLLSKAAKDDKWYDDSSFLSKLSTIPFIVMEKTEQLNWIVKQANATTNIMQHDSYIELASPSQSATLDCASLIWTVKPVINLHLPFFPSVESIAIVHGLKVTQNSTVSPDDIIKNIRTICNGGIFANFSLFDAYPEDLKPPEGVKGLMEVMLEIFQRLERFTESIDIITLSSLPCIPVYSTPAVTSKWQLVLVKPCHVINSSEAEKFHPYLYNMPDDLSPVLTLLRKIGLKNSIDISHVQTILENAYTQADNEKLEVNTHKCVVEALKRLKVLLQDKKRDSGELESDLAPLYLPTSEGKLHLSTDLMYSDTSAYRGKLDLKMEDIPYALLQIKSLDFSFTDSDLCDLLPAGIRPKKMSKLCRQEIVSLCDEVNDSLVTSKIKATLKVSLLPEAVLKIITQYTKFDDTDDKLKPFIDTFLANIKVLTVRNLKTSIKFTETGTEIGKVKSDFFLQHKDDHHCCLYLDSKLNNLFDGFVMVEITDHIISQMKAEYSRIEPEALKEVRRVLNFLFKVQDNTEVEMLLNKEGIAIQSEDMDFPAPEFGKEIPVCWHHRLDQDLDNIFFPTEWVGYEDRENHIVFAQVAYPILTEDQTDFDSIPRVGLKYKVYLKNNDLEGSEVYGLDLYKFIKGKSKVKVEQVVEETIVLYEGDGSADAKGSQRTTINSEELKSVKEKICKELREIWKLSEDLRKKAIKRLYLKWHPDKNPDNPDFAEEVFKFLQSQIKRMERGETISSDDTPFSSSERTWSYYDFSSWDNTARDHSHWSRKEQNYYSSRHHSHDFSSGFGASSFFHESSQTNKEGDVAEGWRWIKQAEVDFRMLVASNTVAQQDPDLKGYGLVCYMAHQVAEKALQGGVFALCGKDKRNITDHNLSHRAYMIQAKKLGQTFGLLSHVTPLESYYLNTRYPNRWPNDTDIPADHYSASEAEAALDHAKFVLEMVKNFMTLS